MEHPANLIFIEGVPSVRFDQDDVRFVFRSDAPTDGMSHRKSRVAAAAPASWAAMNPGASASLIPEKVLLMDRARVTAGLAKDVDAVNQ
jgi:hypothetical protein